MPLKTDQNTFRTQSSQKSNHINLDVPHEGPVQGKAIHELFNKDTLNCAASVQVPQKPSFFAKIAPWLYTPQVSGQPTTAISKTVSDLAIQKAEPIQTTPELDRPELPPNASLEGVVPKMTPQLLLKAGKKDEISEKEIVLALSEMSSKTIDEVIAIVLKAEMELARDGAEIAEDSYSRLSKVRKLQEKTLDEIRDALQKDSNLLGKLNTANKIALAASFIAAAAGLIVAFSICPAFALPALPAIAMVAEIGIPATALAAGMTTAGKGYANYRGKQDKAKLESHRHEMTKSSESADNYREQLVTHGESESHYKEAYVRFLRALEKIKNKVLQQ
ncbi:MAG: hypothetical protein H0V82_06415 [Candidatus Protochlamydia sp.]|nr:hypothetical protein [Candidatus Protochlamydia sp.]